MTVWFVCGAILLPPPLSPSLFFLSNSLFVCKSLSVRVNMTDLGRKQNRRDDQPWQGAIDVFSNPKCDSASSMLRNNCTSKNHRMLVINNCKMILNNPHHTKCFTRYNCDPMDVFNVSSRTGKRIIRFIPSFSIFSIAGFKTVPM